MSNIQEVMLLGSLDKLDSLRQILTSLDIREPLQDRQDVEERVIELTQIFGKTKNASLEHVTRLLQLLSYLSHGSQGEVYCNFATEVLRILQVSKDRVAVLENGFKPCILEHLKIIHQLVKAITPKRKDSVVIQGIITNIADYVKDFPPKAWDSSDAVQILELGLSIWSAAPPSLRKPLMTIVADALIATAGTGRDPDMCFRMILAETGDQLSFGSQFGKPCWDAADEIEGQILTAFKDYRTKCKQLTQSRENGKAVQEISDDNESKLSATGHVDDVRGKFERLERRTTTLEENFEITAKYTALLEKQGVMEKELEESWAGLRTMKDCISSTRELLYKERHKNAELKVKLEELSSNLASNPPTDSETPDESEAPQTKSIHELGSPKLSQTGDSEPGTDSDEWVLDVN